MKKIAGITAIVILIMTTAGWAEMTEAELLSKAEQGYIIALKSDNSGLRYNAICQIVQLKSRYPNANLEKTEKILKKISKKNDHPLICAHAIMAIAYLNNDDLNQTTKLVFNGDPTNFFNEMNSATIIDFYNTREYEENSGVYEQIALLPEY